MTAVLERSLNAAELAGQPDTAPASAAPVTIQCRTLCTPTMGCPLAPGSEWCPDDTSGCPEC